MIIPATLVALFVLPSIADAASCLSSAEEVRKAQPNAWPRWTYGPNRERCWYAGQKPVFAKAPPELAAPTNMPMTPSTSSIEPELDGRNPEPIRQPWALEYHWALGDAPELR
jgi:hypothetical protein